MANEIYKTSSIGRKIEGVRKIVNVSQETLASRIGISRQGLFKLEQTGNIDEEKLSEIADALGVSVDAIKNYNEDAVINYIQNNYDNTQSPNIIFGDNTHLHSVEQLMQLVEENKKLYERLLQSEQDKVAMMQSLLNKK